jgi:DNA-directed RNA polymerase omega subunit
MLKDDVKDGDKGNLKAADSAQNDQWPGVDSVFRLIIVAAQRAKQLRNGALPRVPVDPKNQRHTYVALKEVKQGKISFDVNEISHHDASREAIDSDDVKTNKTGAKAVKIEQSWLI